ncbi:MAG: PDZ domain-containing protein, partial [Limisphaerales bacterium]
FPPEFKHPPKAALLITALRTNTPAQLAGLSEGDLILELNHQPATRLRSFYRTIDLSQPGTLLPVTAWHDGQTMELEVPVGKETYTKCARLGIGLPPRFAALGLWPNPDFSLVVLGFETESLDTRLDVGSAREKYLKSCGPKNYTAEDKGWNAWLAVLWADVSGQVRSQENVVPPIASQPPIAATAAVGH